MHIYIYIYARAHTRTHTQIHDMYTLDPLLERLMNYGRMICRSMRLLLIPDR